MTHLGSRECIATTAAHVEFFAEYSGGAFVAKFAGTKLHTFWVIPSL
jgi:hypothetical protein